MQITRKVTYKSLGCSVSAIVDKEIDDVTDWRDVERRDPWDSADARDVTIRTGDVVRSEDALHCEDVVSLIEDIACISPLEYKLFKTHTKGLSTFPVS